MAWKGGRACSVELLAGVVGLVGLIGLMGVVGGGWEGRPPSKQLTLRLDATPVDMPSGSASPRNAHPTDSVHSDLAVQYGALNRELKRVVNQVGQRLSLGAALLPPTTSDPEFPPHPTEPCGRGAR
jgi:hypothetical protein